MEWNTGRVNRGTSARPPCSAIRGTRNSGGTSCSPTSREDLAAREEFRFLGDLGMMERVAATMRCRTAPADGTSRDRRELTRWTG